MSYCYFRTKNTGKEIIVKVSETSSELRNTSCQTERTHEMHNKVDVYRLKLTSHHCDISEHKVQQRERSISFKQKGCRSFHWEKKS